MIERGPSDRTHPLRFGWSLSKKPCPASAGIATAIEFNRGAYLVLQALEQRGHVIGFVPGARELAVAGDLQHGITMTSNRRLPVRSRFAQRTDPCSTNT